MIRVYQFGLRPPTEGEAYVRSELRGSALYRNSLAEIERGRRTALRALWAEYGDFARGSDDARREARRKMKGDPAFRERTATINALARALVRNAREHRPTHWGTGGLVEAAIDQTRKAPLYDRGLPLDPQPVPVADIGRVGIQITERGGIAWTKAMEDDTRIRVRVVPDRGSPERGRRRAHRVFAELRLRLGTTADRAPIWVAWPMLMHREIPGDARLKSAAVSLRRLGPSEVWTAELTVDDVPAAPHAPVVRGSMVAVSFDMRDVEGGVRAAAWAASDGTSGEIRVPESIVSALMKCDELRSIRQRRFTVARDTMLARLAEVDTPSWLVALLATMEEWRSPNRLHHLARTWAARRFMGDEIAFEALSSWRHDPAAKSGDLHLWTWESRQRRRAIRHRREIYRGIAALLTSRYEALAIRKADLRRLQAESVDDEEDKTARASRRAKRLVAAGALQLALLNAARARGTRLVEIAAREGFFERGAVLGEENRAHALLSLALASDRDASGTIPTARATTEGGAAAG